MCNVALGVNDAGVAFFPCETYPCPHSWMCGICPECHHGVIEDLKFKGPGWLVCPNFSCSRRGLSYSYESPQPPPHPSQARNGPETGGDNHPLWAASDDLYAWREVFSNGTDPFTSGDQWEAPQALRASQGPPENGSNNASPPNDFTPLSPPPPPPPPYTPQNSPPSPQVPNVAEAPRKKRGRGRPLGSRNKPKVPDAEQKVKRGRGRPKGTKNKPKVQIAQDKPVDTQEAQARAVAAAVAAAEEVGASHRYVGDTPVAPLMVHAAPMPAQPPAVTPAAPAPPAAMNLGRQDEFGVGMPVPPFIVQAAPMPEQLSAITFAVGEVVDPYRYGGGIPSAPGTTHAAPMPAQRPAVTYTAAQIGSPDGFGGYHGYRPATQYNPSPTPPVYMAQHTQWQMHAAAPSHGQPLRPSLPHTQNEPQGYGIYPAPQSGGGQPQGGNTYPYGHPGPSPNM